MKKFISLILIALLFTLSCSDSESSDDIVSTSENGIIGTWVLIKTVSNEEEVFEDCSSAMQFQFINDRNEDNLGTFLSFEDDNCNGNIDAEFEGTYLYQDGDQMMTINFATGFQEFIVETLNDNDLVLFDGFQNRMHFKNSNVVDEFGINPSDELVADFNILPLCCPPTTITERYLDEVEIEFENLSSGNIAEYEWSFGSSEENPTETFPLNMSFIENTLTFELTVTDNEGNSDSVEKSIDLPILAASGTITFGGETCEINFLDNNPDLPILPPYYSSRMDMGQWVSYGINDVNCSGSNIPSPVIHLGNFKPVQTFNMKQVGDFDPTDPNTFYVSFGSYSTFDDNTGTISDGSVDLTGFENGAKVINELNISGVVTDDFTGDSKNFDISISNIPFICYYDLIVLCDAQPDQ
ncbi:lipocalin family protein [Flavobacteriaceae bacterium 14752]|uniref:lipocalin family protein n=1 Tax=Mesohalobacter salilacus TaxID=2491711 RepID=UPI000F643BC9|nr:hypothetical protein EIG84_01820 [Flavobacteriaceae bacterium 14752]